MNINMNFPAGGIPSSLSFRNPGAGGQMQLRMMMQLMQMMMQLTASMTGGVGMPQLSRFGGAPQAQNGMNAFLGGPQRGGGSSPGSARSGAPPQLSAGRGVAPSQLSPGQGSTALGQSLARDAERNANGPGGRCYEWVANSLERHGIKVYGGSAYMAADQLAKNPRFREVRVQPADLPKLPAGAVVVWNRGKGHPHGHISIATGDGREASDKMRPQATRYGTTARVFLPR